MDTPSMVDEVWNRLLTYLPADFEEQAFRLGALRRRREVRSALQLLHLLLGYVLAPVPSLRLTAQWAESCHLATLSSVALLKRFRQAGDWLAYLVSQLLLQGLSREGLPTSGLRVRLLDATTLQGPGARGTAYRLHATLDLQTLSFRHLEVTDAHGGESLLRAAPEAGELIVADRGYCHRKALWAVLQQGAHWLLRFPLSHLPLQDREGHPVQALALAQQLEPGAWGDFPLQSAPLPREGLPAMPLRVLVQRQPPEAAEAARRRVRQEAQRKGHTPRAETLASCDFLFWVTSLPESTLSASQAFALYRLRWQIELAFKRLKSLHGLVPLPFHNPAAVQTFLQAKLLLVLLVDRLRAEAPALSPLRALGTAIEASPTGAWSSASTSCSRACSTAGTPWNC